MFEEKKEHQRHSSLVKLEETKRKLAMSSLKREQALSSQRETIERKIQLNNIKAQQ
jgi:hypothetical protein